MAKVGTKRKREPWENDQGWKSVETGDGLLIGASEGGFCMLEEFTPTESVQVQTQDKKARATETPKTRKSGKKSVDKKTKGSDDLQKQLATAEAEAARLRALVKRTAQKRKKEDPGPEVPLQSRAQGSEDHTEQADVPEKVLNHRERKRLQRAAYKSARRELLKRERAALRKKQKTPGPKSTPQANTVNSASYQKESASALDMAAWKPYDLDPGIEEALAAQGFKTPTPIQQECLPAAIRDRRDVIGAAETGSGKTLAFGLPIIQALLEERQSASLAATPEAGKRADSARTLRALILTPTRELAIQVSEHLLAIARPCGIWVVPIVGGIALEKQERFLRSRPEIVVATPGRLWELMRDGKDHLTKMDDLSFLVLDEADRMVQQGHYEELSSILEFVPQSSKVTPGKAEQEDLEEQPGDLRVETAMENYKKRALQTFVFSATLTLPESLRKRLKRGGGGSSGSVTLENLMEKIAFGHKPKIADLTSSRRVAEKVAESYLECTEDNRDERLYYLLTQHPGRTLVFANAISMVRRLAAVLKLLQLDVVAMHSSMQQRQRLKALDRFKASESAVLIATDVAARGLDIPEVACVVHYQLPAAADVYVHRCGRTARASAEGISVALVAPKEAARFAALRKAMGQDSLPLFPVDSNLLPGARKRVQLAVKLDEVLRSSSKKAAEQTWEEQMAQAAGIILSDGEGRETTPDARRSVKAKTMQQELTRLLQEPLQPKYSQRFFAGLPSAALAVRDQEDSGNRMLSPTAISEAVLHAKDLAEARSAGAAALAAKQKRKKARSTPPVSSSGLERHKDGKKFRAAGRKEGMGKSRFVVIPGAVARQGKGMKALDALKNKLMASQGSIATRAG